MRIAISVVSGRARCNNAHTEGVSNNDPECDEGDHNEETWLQ